MNDYLECPFCKKIFALTKDTFYEACTEFDSNNWKNYKKKNSEDKIEYLHLDTSGLIIQFNKCPACKKVTIDIIGAGSQFLKDSDEEYSQHLKPNNIQIIYQAIF